MSSSTIQASIAAKVTKAAVISILTFLAGVLTYAASSNPKYAFVASLIGYALGDAITFLQGSTLTDKWSYASKTVLLTAVLTVVGTYVAQLVSANAISPYIGALIGYAISEAVYLLEGSAMVPTPQPTPPISPSSPTTAPPPA